MLKFIADFLNYEKQKEGIELKEFPNGTEYVNSSLKKYNYLHSFYNPLNDEQIDKLQNDVNVAQKASIYFLNGIVNFLKLLMG